MSTMAAVELHVMWSLEFGYFVKDVVGYNLNDCEAALLLCKLEGNQLLTKSKW
jgi:hypothetical protein